MTNIHRAMAGVIAACAVLTASTDFPHEVTLGAAIVAVLAHAVEAGVDGYRKDTPSA